METTGIVEEYTHYIKKANIGLLYTEVSLDECKGESFTIRFRMHHFHCTRCPSSPFCQTRSLRLEFEWGFPLFSCLQIRLYY
jgi:hypothetical protein